MLGGTLTKALGAGPRTSLRLTVPILSSKAEDSLFETCSWAIKSLVSHWGDCRAVSNLLRRRGIGNRSHWCWYLNLGGAEQPKIRGCMCREPVPDHQTAVHRVVGIPWPGRRRDDGSMTTIQVVEGHLYSSELVRIHIRGGAVPTLTLEWNGGWSLCTATTNGSGWDDM